MKPHLSSALASIARRHPFLLLGGATLLGFTVSSLHAQTIYVSSGNDILKVTPSGTVSDYAILPVNAQAAGLAFDGSGDLYVADAGQDVIREITSTGMLSTFATVPNSSPAGVGGLAFDSSGNLYVADGNIFKISPTGVVSTFATLPANSDALGLAFDGNGNLYAADSNTNQITKITSQGVVSLFASLPANTFPYGLAFDGSGNLYSAGLQTNLINKITSTGVVSTFATLPASSFPEGLAFDGSGNLYSGDIDTNQISKISPDGVVTTFASNVQNASFIAIYPAPEPSTWAMMLGSLGVLGFVRRFRRTSAV